MSFNLRHNHPSSTSSNADCSGCKVQAFHQRVVSEDRKCTGIYSMSAVMLHEAYRRSFVYNRRRRIFNA
jgi:hypothetical protein